MPFKTLILTTLVFFLSGCELGFESSVTQASDHDRHAAILKHARVTVSAIGLDSIRTIASTRTDEAGNFSLPAVNHDGPLLVQVLPAADGSSSLVCRAPDGCGRYADGQAMPVPESLRLMTLVSAHELNESGLSVNPYTSLLIDEVLKAPGLIRDQVITAARHRVAQRFQLPEGFWQRQNLSTASRAAVSGNAWGMFALEGDRSARLVSAAHEIKPVSNGTVRVF
jgi:hypothetical protein